jgi:excisionase family DNA binding protein
MGKSAVRLMSLQDAAAYMGISYWSLREFVADGVLPAVRLPGTRIRAKGGKVVRHASAKTSMRRVLVDRRDLDALIEQCKPVVQDEGKEW